MDRDGQVEARPLNPIALSLAIWLAFVVGVTGLTRLQQEASAQAALDEAAGKPAPSLTTDDAQLFAARTMALGS